MTDAQAPDFLAVITLAHGGGSWMRDPDRATSIKRAARIFKEDWSHLFKVGEKGSTVKVNVIDCTGFDKTVTFDVMGFWEVDEDGRCQPLSLPVTTETYTY
jgi:hypothetical protein